VEVQTVKIGQLRFRI